MAHILDTIELFLKRNPEMTATKLGREALGDPRFVFDLRGTGYRSPRRLKPETEARVASYLKGYAERKRTGNPGCLEIHIAEAKARAADARALAAAATAKRAAIAAEAAARTAQAAAVAADQAAARVEEVRAA